MRTEPSTPFSNGTKYENFTYYFCTRCKKGKRRCIAMIRRDYTNGSGYVCPTENAAIREMDKPRERPVTTKPHSGIMREGALKKLDRPTPMQALAQIAEREMETLKKARALWNALSGIAAVMDWSITAIELKPKGSPDRYYKDGTTKTLEKRC